MSQPSTNPFKQNRPASQLPPPLPAQNPSQFPPQLPPHNNTPPQLPPHNNLPPQLPPHNNLPPQLPPHNNTPPQLPPQNVNVNVLVNVNVPPQLPPHNTHSHPLPQPPTREYSATPPLLPLPPQQQQFSPQNNSQSGPSPSSSESSGIPKQSRLISDIEYPFNVSYNDDYIYMNDLRHQEDGPFAIEKKDGRVGEFIHNNIPANTYSNNFEVYFILGIITIEGISYLVCVTEREKVADFQGRSIYKVTGSKFLSFKPISLWIKNPADKDQKAPFWEVQKFVQSGLFYFSYDYHLTHSMQRQHALGAELDKPLWEVADRDYFWNYYLMRHFIKRKMDDWVIPVIRGFAFLDKSAFIPSTCEKLEVLLISKISCKRAGTRYNARGVNDDGNVANFVETEQTVFIQGHQISIVLCRGSVPVFWEQGLIKGKHEPELSRTKEATAPSFNKHIKMLLDKYQRIHICDLLEGKKREGVISQAYKDHITLCPHTNAKQIVYTHWDFHAECGNSKYENIGRLFPVVEEDIKSFGYFHIDANDRVISKQTGVFRVNCLDCLDRTNVILGTIAYWALPMQLAAIGVIQNEKFSEYSKIAQVFKVIWADNGDNISNSYTGTGAMKSAYTRTGKRTIKGMVDDSKKSLERVYQNNFKDNDKQEAIDMFLGNIEEDIEIELSPHEKWVQSQLNLRESHYTTLSSKKIFIGTWNCNSTVPPKITDDLDCWLCPETKDFEHDQVDIYVFGFQEIVKLNTGSIMQADEEHKKQWGEVLLYILNSKRVNSKVILAGSVQLVGIAILVFVKASDIEVFRGFQIMKRKTAASGFAGNKGALSARFDFEDTSICCVCAHLTAHQSKVNERIKDINDILAKTRFSAHHTPTIPEHDHQFWFGDFNFRIDCSYAETLARIRNEDLAYLQEFDQLKKAVSLGLIFRDYYEAPINFNPTYKFDVGTDNYDTSDQQRIPAWCDRIVFTSKAGLRIRHLAYSCGSELRLSDHKPIKGLFEIDIKKIDHDSKRRIENLLVSESKSVSAETLNNHATPYNSLNLPVARPMTPLPASGGGGFGSAPVPERKLSNPAPHKATPLGDYTRLPDRPSSSPNPFAQHISSNAATPTNSNSQHSSNFSSPVTTQPVTPTPSVNVFQVAPPQSTGPAITVSGHFPTPEKRRGTMGHSDHADDHLHARALPTPSPSPSPSTNHANPNPVPNSLPSTPTHSSSQSLTAPTPSTGLNTSTTKRRTVVSPASTSVSNANSTAEFGFGDSSSTGASPQPTSTTTNRAVPRPTIQLPQIQSNDPGPVSPTSSQHPLSPTSVSGSVSVSGSTGAGTASPNPASFALSAPVGSTNSRRASVSPQQQHNNPQPATQNNSAPQQQVTAQPSVQSAPLPPTLPPNWTAYQNEGRTYYFNHVTQVSQWDFPTS